MTILLLLLKICSVHYTVAYFLFEGGHRHHHSNSWHVGPPHFVDSGACERKSPSAALAVGMESRESESRVILSR